MKMDYKINERYEKDGVLLNNHKFDIFSRVSGTDDEYDYERTEDSIIDVYLFLSEVDVGGLVITENNVEVVE